MLDFDWILSSTPEEQGVPSGAILDFLDAVKAENLELHSLHIIRGGHMIFAGVARPFTDESRHRIFSAAKGIVAAGVLFLVQDGLLSLDEPVLPLCEGHLPPHVAPAWRRLTVYHLLTMQTGHDRETFSAMRGSDDWVRAFFETAPAQEPGTGFYYDIGAQYVLNHIIALKSGMPADEYLKLRLFDPLDIAFDVQHGAQGILNSSTFQLRPIAMAKLAYFYLCEGAWGGRQLLSRELAREAGRMHVPNSAHPGGAESRAGYALHMWRNSVGGFRLDGGKGQFSIVLPEADMAVGMTANEPRAQRLLELFFEKVYGRLYARQIPVDARALLRVGLRMDEMNLAPWGAISNPALEEEIDGQTFTFYPNRYGWRSLRFVFSRGSVRLTADGNAGVKVAVIRLGGKWAKNKGYIFAEKDPADSGDLDRIYGPDPADSLYSGGWTSNSVFRFFMRSDGLLPTYEVTCDFTCGDLELTLSPNMLEQPEPRGAFPFVAPPSPAPRKLYARMHA